jgi:hypothetical protein
MGYNVCYMFDAEYQSENHKQEKERDEKNPKSQNHAVCTNNVSRNLYPVYRERGEKRKKIGKSAL